LERTCRRAAADLADGLFGCFQRAEETDEPQNFEYKLPIQEEQLWFEARIVRTGDDKILSVVRDITDRKQAEETMRESDQRLRLGLQAARMIAWDWETSINRLITIGDASEIYRWIQFRGSPCSTPKTRLAIRQLSKTPLRKAAAINRSLGL
jgi:hypothetical protein